MCRRSDRTMTVRCCICGSENWLRADPGEGDDATHLTPAQAQTVLLFPSEGRPCRAWCAKDDPLLHKNTKNSRPPA